jgi:predicted Rossmann fold nucleotide-binding protein DprA/Smf involved in DNA uptake
MEIKILSRDQSNYPITSQGWFQESDYIGNIELINLPMLAIFSSIKCPARLILAAHDAAHEIAAEGKTVIGGFQSPTEKEMLEVLLRGASPLVICPARGLDGMRIPVAWRQKIEKGQLLVISPFACCIKRTKTEVVIKRNELVACLVEELLIVHADEGGKVESLAMDALSNKKRVWVLDDKSMLEKKGAKNFVSRRESERGA